MTREIIVHAAAEETWVALLEDRVLVELYVEQETCQRLVGNIYKGRVENVLPGMQAAFVNIGLERNAFLFVADAVPRRQPVPEEEDPVPVAGLNIRDVLQEGQEVVVQVAKEPIGGKGARVTTHLTLPGRNLVLMPQVDYVGVSRRIEDEKERERLRAAARKLKPEGMGLIV
ncbi:MAG: ribonuclease, partial [Bacillota bacterium]|nr:ribonuclease [Bacillota bacterium]